MAADVEDTLEELRDINAVRTAVELAKISGSSVCSMYRVLSFPLHVMNSSIYESLLEEEKSGGAEGKGMSLPASEVKIANCVGLKPGSKSICFLDIPVPTPFAINIANVEYCKGRMNPDTNRYELKIGLVSGRDLTLEGEAAMSFLTSISENYSADVDGSKSLKAKFQSKSGS